MSRFGKIFRINGPYDAKMPFIFLLACCSSAASAAGDATSSSAPDAISSCRLIDDRDWAPHQCQGPCVNGVVDGLGVVRFLNGDELRGQFKQGQLMNGKAEVRYASGEVYVGGVRNGVPDGEGVYTWRNGDSYKGPFERGKKHGTGQYTEVQSGRQFQVRYQDDFLEELSRTSTSALSTAAQEEKDLEKFRRTLRAGDQTNLGLVIEIRRKDGLVLVQAEGSGLFGVPRYNYEQRRSSVDYALAPQVNQRWVKLSDIRPPASQADTEQEDRLRRQ